MKKTVGLILILCMLMGCMAITSAENNLYVEAELCVSDFYVEIHGAGLKEYSRTAILAVPAQDNYTELDSARIAYAAQLETGKDGRLDIRARFMSNAPEGEYYVYLTDQAGNVSARSNKFTYRTEQSLNDALAEFNQSNSENMKDIVNTCGEAILLDMTEYEDFKDEYDAEIGTLLYRLKGEKFDSAGDLHKKFKAAVLTVLIDKVNDTEGILEKYAADADVDMTEFDSCSREVKSAACSALKKRSYNLPEDLNKFLPEAIFSGKVASASTAGEINDIFMNEYSERLKLDKSDYKLLSNKNQVFVKLFNQRTEIYDYASAEKLFSSAAEKLREKPTASGGGGGGGGGSSFSVPKKEENKEPENNQEEDDGDNPNDKPEEDVSKAYSDLDSVPWAEEAINMLSERKIISGDGNGKFRPEDKITRAEFVKIIISAMDIDCGDIGEVFTDVKKDEWYAPYITAGFNAGIVNGISEDSFGVNENISRQDLVVICMRAAEYKGIALSAQWETAPLDADSISDYAKAAVEVFYGLNIVGGDTDGNFRPFDSASRAEAAKIAAGFLRIAEV